MVTSRRMALSDCRAPEGSRPPSCRRQPVELPSGVCRRPRTPKQRTSTNDRERWRWDLNPRTGYPVTRFRVLRTHVQARSETSAPCSTGRSASVAEPSRTTTNETRTETRQLRRRESDSCPAGCGISEPCSGRCPSPRLAERGRGGRPGKRGPRRPLRRCALSTSTPSQSRSPVPPSRPPVCYLPMPSVRPRRNRR
jgi:hypothetical protein